MSNDPGDEDRTVYQPKGGNGDGDNDKGKKPDDTPEEESPEPERSGRHEPTEIRPSPAPSPARAPAHEPTEILPSAPPPAAPPPPPPPPAPSPAPAPKPRGDQQFSEGDVLNGIYRIERFLARGGMGEVYEARNVHQQSERVAIKVMLAHMAQDELVAAMFAKESEMLTRLHHEAIVPYRMAARDDQGRPYLVTEFIDGPSLEKLILDGQRFSTPELLTLLGEVCIGLRAAHKAGVVHRDLAPDNVLLEEGDIDRPKIIDFGIVKDTKAGETIIGTGFAGKLNFVAPEQLGEPEYEIGPWTDIYSLALVILGLANGKEIDMGHTPGAAIRKRHEPIDLSPVEPELRSLLSDMLATHPDHRLRSTDEVMQRVEQIQRGEPEADPWPAGADKTVVVPAAEMNALYRPVPEPDKAPEPDPEPLPVFDDPEPELVDDEAEDWDEADYEIEPPNQTVGNVILLVILAAAIIALGLFAAVTFGGFSLN
ncbi:MAG: protein kinase [Erythrobacter sp.]|nr:protein kinase [Erythrobacter sp.]